MSYKCYLFVREVINYKPCAYVEKISLLSNATFSGHKFTLTNVKIMGKGERVINNVLR